MKHPDEHTLELFVVGSAHVARRRGSIKAHLDRCADCRRIVARMREFYGTVEREIAHLDSTELHPVHALVRRTNALQQEHLGSEVPARPAKFTLAHFPLYSTLRRYPVATGAGSMLVLAGLLWGIMLLINARPKDTNPTWYRYNIADKTIEIYNKEDVKIWEKSPLDVQSPAQEEDAGGRYTQVSDIDNDGRNEVVTILPFRNLGDNVQETKVRLFRSANDFTLLGTIRRGVSFGGYQYQMEYSPRGLLIWDDSTTHRKSIFVTAINFRSPSVLVGFDDKGNSLGEYWHEGHIAGIRRVNDLGPGHGDYLVLMGVNDARDSAGISFPMVIVLDPKKMRGLSESSATPGFGLPASSAEEYYIKLPEADVFKAVGIKTHVRRMIANDERGFAVIVKASDLPAIEVSFTRDLVVKSVQPVDTFELLHARLVKEGKIHSTLDQHYFDKLKSDVRYWDGKTWRSEVVAIQH